MTHAPKTITHYYDTHDRRVGCGEVGPEDHSSKHERSVTCPACLERLADRPATAIEAPAASS